MPTAAHPEPLVVDLADLRAASLAGAGGKAANLGELLAAGFPVPGGFCVTTAAFPQVAVDPRESPAQRRARVLAAPVPAAVEHAVRTAYAALSGGGPDPTSDVPVAVRSSATAEDLPGASFAGQQDTYLHVVGADAVLAAVRRCWASLYTDRAVSYRAQAGVAEDGVALAVVVQQMVDAAVAGVLFTADPVSGRRTRTVIDAAPGLGEAVVSGAVDPDHVVVEGDGRVVEHRVGGKRVAIRARPGGGTERVERAAGATGPCLDAAVIAALVALGRRVEAHFGVPQDIEWAIDTAGTVRLTQARPITTLHPVPGPATGPGLRAYLCASLAQGLTRPITPMGISAFRLITAGLAREALGVTLPDPAAGPPALAVGGGRVFADITPALRNAVGRRLLPAVLGVMEARSAPVVRGLLTQPEFALRTRSPRTFARAVLRVAVRYRVPVLLALALARPDRARSRVAAIARDLDARAAVPPGVGDRERLDHAEAVLVGAFQVMPRVVPVAGAGFLALGLARALARPELDADALHEVLRGLPHNSTTEMDLRLWDLATRLRADPVSVAALRERDPAHPEPPPPVLRDGLRAFLDRHGHRAVAEIDLGMPRWSDDPAHVLGALANYLRLEDPADAPDVRFARAGRAAQEAVARVVRDVRRRSKPRAVAVGFLLGRARALTGMREEHKDLLIRLLAHARAAIAAVGRGLADRGLLDAPDDVFFLELPEVRAALDGADHRALVTARRAGYDRELRRRRVPRILLSDGTEPEALAAAATAGDDGLAGTPASAGTCTAPARVVLDPVGAHLEPGEVLVAPSTDPGWTPLFLTAGALVMEMGGANSHGAVVAREYGIPAVVGVPDATTRIATGRRVTVDGAAGRVRIEEPDEGGATAGR